MNKVCLEQGQSFKALAWHPYSNVVVATLSPPPRGVISLNLSGLAVDCDGTKNRGTINSLLNMVLLESVIEPRRSLLKVESSMDVIVIPHVNTVKPPFTDTRLIWTLQYYGQFALSLGKEIPYTFYKFNPLNTDTQLQELFHEIQPN